MTEVEKLWIQVPMKRGGWACSQGGRRTIKNCGDNGSTGALRAMRENI